MRATRQADKPVGQCDVDRKTKEKRPSWNFRQSVSHIVSLDKHRQTLCDKVRSEIPRNDDSFLSMIDSSSFATTAAAAAAAAAASDHWLQLVCGHVPVWRNGANVAANSRIAIHGRTS